MIWDLLYLLLTVDNIKALVLWHHASCGCYVMYIVVDCTSLSLQGRYSSDFTNAVHYNRITFYNRIVCTAFFFKYTKNALGTLLTTLLVGLPKAQANTCDLYIELLVTNRNLSLVANYVYSPVGYYFIIIIVLYR